MTDALPTKPDPATVLWWFVWHATDNGVRNVGRVRLVKLLYLLEVEYFRLRSDRLTALTWKFYHYGPYPIEFETLIERSGLADEQIALSASRILKALRLPEFAAQQPTLPDDVDHLARRLVREWSDASLNRLLNYVYFETEPMQNAKRGEVLDFHTIRPREKAPAAKREIDMKRFRMITKNLAERLNEITSVHSQMIPDPALQRCLQPWDEEAGETLVSGTVMLKPGETESGEG